MSIPGSTAADLDARVATVLPVLREHAARVDADAVFPVASMRALREPRWQTIRTQSTKREHVDKEAP